MKNRFIKKELMLIVLVIVLSFFVFANNIEAVAVPAKSVISDTFPESYVQGVNRLKSAHPNWNIKAFYTNLDWSTVINVEASGVYSRISDSSYGDAWKRLESVNDKNYDASGFVLASRAAVAYVIDSRNFLNDQDIFQFRVVNQNVSSDTESTVNEITHGTPMKDTDYASIVKRVGDNKNIAPTFIMSRIRQETGCNTVSNGSINGKNSTYPGYYNFFNIGATDGKGAVQRGINLAYAKEWDNPEKAISGGIDEIIRAYINYGQYTTYFQKFDVANPFGNAKVILSSQYMTNITAPLNESRLTYNGMSRANTLNNEYTFYVPVYDNMPSTVSLSPGSYENDNTKVYLDDKRDTGRDDTFTIRSTPDSSNSTNIVDVIVETMEGQNNRTVITRTKKGIDTGWDYVEYEKNGQKIQGYVWNSYVYVRDYVKVTGITLNKANTILKIANEETLAATVSPTDAVYKDVTWSSSNTNIVIVDENGKIKGIAKGSAVITATTKDEAKTATCVVNVTDKDPSISLNKDRYNLLRGNKVDYEVILNDTNETEHEVSIADTSIARINDGKIEGLVAGETTITVKIKGTNYTDTATVKVVALQNEELVFDDSITVNEGVITKIGLGTKKSELLGKITYGNGIEIKNMSGTVLGDNDLIGTGTTIDIKDADGNILQTYTALIYGDINGDGRTSPSDYVKIKNHILGTETMYNISLKAGDVNKDNKITPGDYVKVKNCILGTESIVQ